MVKSQHSKKPEKHKLTRGAASVLAALRNTHQLTSAQDLYGSLRSKDNKAPGLTTIYRALDSLLANGLVQTVDLGDGEKRYELVVPGEHHHHLICERCQTSIHLDQCFVASLEEALKQKHGFQIRSHVLEIFGLCKRCRKDA